MTNSNLMKKMIIIDSQVSGISGDLFLSSLVDCGADVSKIIKNIKRIEKFFYDASIKKIDFINTESNGMRAKKFVFEFVESRIEKNALEMITIFENCCNNVILSEKAKKFVMDSVKTLINAESVIHNKELKDLHLHESSSIDTGADLIGCATALDNLDLLNDTVFYTTKVAIGGGFTKFSHGIVSNPANAILEIFRKYEIPIMGGPVDTEITTPTGATVLVNLNPIVINTYPELILCKIGYGTGSKIFSGIPNILKTTIAKPIDHINIRTDEISILETNLDDINGELLGRLIEKLNSISKVKDVTVLSGLTKKNRPVFVLKVICSEDIEKNIAEMIFLETGTLGIRRQKSERYILERSNMLIPIKIEEEKYTINVKVSKDLQGRIINMKPEFKDIKEISSRLNYPLKKTSDLVNNLIFQNYLHNNRQLERTEQ